MAAEAAARGAMVPAGGPARRAGGVRGDRGRMDRDGGRTPALDRAGRDADRGRRHHASGHRVAPRRNDRRVRAPRGRVHVAAAASGSQTAGTVKPQERSSRDRRDLRARRPVAGPHPLSAPGRSRLRRRRVGSAGGGSPQGTAARAHLRCDRARVGGESRVVDLRPHRAPRRVPERVRGSVGRAVSAVQSRAARDRVPGCRLRVPGARRPGVGLGANVDADLRDRVARVAVPVRRLGRLDRERPDPGSRRRGAGGSRFGVDLAAVTVRRPVRRRDLRVPRGDVPDRRGAGSRRTGARARLPHAGDRIRRRRRDPRGDRAGGRPRSGPDPLAGHDRTRHPVRGPVGDRGAGLDRRHRGRLPAGSPGSPPRSPSGPSCGPGGPPSGPIWWSRT